MEKRLEDRVKVVVIERPYDTFQNNKQVRELMGRVWKMKLDGYRSHYDYGIMPVSDADFFADHVVFCEEIQGELIPFCGSKSICTDICNIAGMKFPVTEHLFGGNEEVYPIHVQESNHWIKDKTDRGFNVGYNASWTMCPRVQHDNLLKDLALNLSQAMYYHYYYSKGINHIVTAASKVYKVYRLQERMGFDYLKHDGENLSDFGIRSFGNSPFYMMTLEGGFPDAFASEMSEKFGRYWDERIIFKAPPIEGALKSVA